MWNYKLKFEFYSLNIQNNFVNKMATYAKYADMYKNRTKSQDTRVCIF